MKTINDYATLYYKENIEGEPYDNDIPKICYIEGSKLAIDFAIWAYNYNIYNISTVNLDRKNTKEIFKIFLDEYYEEYKKEIKI